MVAAIVAGRVGALVMKRPVQAQQGRIAQAAVVERALGVPVPLPSILAQDR